MTSVRRSAYTPSAERTVGLPGDDSISLLMRPSARNPLMSPTETSA
jgi:hypothetical protein